MSTFDEWAQSLLNTPVPTDKPAALPETDLASRIEAEVPAEVDEEFKSAAQEAYGKSRGWTNEFNKYGGEYGLPENLLIAVAMAESGGRPGVGSSKGARGLMQFMPATARGRGLIVTDPASKDPALDERLDPTKSIKAAAWKLSRDLKKVDGDIAAALMHYNWGAGNYRKWLKDPNRKMPEETRMYITRVRYAMLIAAQARQKKAQQ